MNKPLHQIYADLNTPLVATKEQYHSAVILIASIVGIAILTLIAGCREPVWAEEITLKASWYSTSSLKKEGTYVYSHGIMANGEYFNDNNLTCANRLYPLGTYLRVTNLESGKAVIVETTDRIGKRFSRTRIDLSKLAFSKLGELEKGIVPVKVEVLTRSF